MSSTSSHQICLRVKNHGGGEVDGKGIVGQSAVSFTAVPHVDQLKFLFPDKNLVPGVALLGTALLLAGGAVGAGEHGRAVLHFDADALLGREGEPEAPGVCLAQSEAAGVT